MTRVLVAGAAGFVGANVMRELAQRPDVTAVGWIRPGGDQWRLAHIPQKNVIPIDITNLDEVTRAIRQLQPDVVINAAAYGVMPQQNDPVRNYDVNVHAVHIILTAARASGVSRVVHLGSYFEYGDLSDVLREDSALMPKSNYAATKAAASLIAASCDYRTMEVVVMRLFNLWGLWESAGRLVPQVIAACRAATPLALTSGTQLKDFVYMGDAAAWIVDLALRQTPVGHRIVNLASGELTMVKTLVSTIAQTMGHLDLMRFGAKPMPATEPNTGPADTSRIDELLPERRKTPIQQALSDVLRAN
ncbi:MAG: SDR family oxidoreductase [Rhodospirillaceae bacterium]|nr:MAG: SDR family oxidoreductase [Rhodospirillaceae bacterium]